MQRPQVAKLPFILLILFTIYVIALYLRVIRDSAARERQAIYWVDTAWYLGFILSTGGASSHFSFFLPFPILFVSLGWGFVPGMAMTVCSAAVLLLSPMFLHVSNPYPLALPALLAPVALLVLGYLIAIWAHSNRALDVRLEYLRKVNTLFSPRLNIEQLTDRMVRELAGLYRPVNKYVLMLAQRDCRPQVFHAVLPGEMSRLPDAAAAELIEATARLGSPDALIYRRRNTVSVVYAHDAKGRTIVEHGADADYVAQRLQCASFCCMHFSLSGGGMARLFVCSDDDCFAQADLAFFRQLAEQMSPRLENIQLLDRLSRTMVENERRKISRDIHDSAIQPYIGLKYALEALNRKVPEADSLAGDIRRLVDVANTEIAELRRYVKSLRGVEEAGHAALVPAIRRQAGRFEDLYGIRIAVQADGELRLDDPVAENVFHMVSEALSNIRRHTRATFASIDLACAGHNLTLRIVNPCDSSDACAPFTPRSISERADAMGGTCQVDIGPGPSTVVSIQVPTRT